MKVRKENYSQSFPTDMSSVPLQTHIFMEGDRSMGLLCSTNNKKISY